MQAGCLGGVLLPGSGFDCLGGFFIIPLVGVYSLGCFFFGCLGGWGCCDWGLVAVLGKVSVLKTRRQTILKMCYTSQLHWMDLRFEDTFRN